MTPARRAYLSELMAKAWFVYRNRTLPGCRVETFADALRNAWAWFKRKALPPVVDGRTLVLRSMLQSPIRRAMPGPYGETRARSLGYVSSMVGR